MKKFKKLTAILLASALTLSMATGVLATDKKDQTRTTDVSLEIKQLVEVIYEGDSIDLSASVAKKGSRFDIEWEVEGVTEEGISYEVSDDSYQLVELGTILETLEVEGSEDLVDTYISTATLTGNKAGLYLVTASVTMTAGNSHVNWTGSDSVTQEFVEIPDALEVDKIIAITTNVEPEKNKQGKITGYNVTYDLYLVYEDGSSDLLTTGATTNLGASGNPKNEDVEHNGTTYNVTVSK